MEKIEEYDVHTERGLHGTVGIYQDVDQDDFVAEYSLAELVPLRKPGTGRNIPKLNPKVGTLRDKEKDQLIEKCKKELTKDGDTIEYFERRSNL